MSTGFHALRIADVKRETDDAISVELDVPVELQSVFAFRPGQHLTLRTEIDGEDVRRNYSICAAPYEKQWKVAIKRLPGGRFSGWANGGLAAGDTIDVMPPTGAFTWSFDPARKAKYALFASGSGITPILSLLKAGLEQEPQSEFALFYGNRDSDSILFLEEIAALKDRFMGRLEVHHFLSREEDEIVLFNGRIDRAKMEEIAGPMLDPKVLEAAFACGPKGMMDAVETALVAGGMAADRIKTERFTTSELSAEQLKAMEELERQAAGRPIKINMDGRKRTISFDPEKVSILENARASGMRAPYACKAGVCATCRAKVVSGKVEMIRNFGLSADEIAEGYVLTCQSIPLTDDVEVDYDA
ncbi:MAG: phenylacetate-CoA oxygenase/reductase subunit PaaK [Alphaproteobacteria bacterium]|nr:MAG: phenylacetate-CoA oxygenase/reductase subunit PaaK [Alphaproteobacteria bacterium]